MAKEDDDIAHIKRSIDELKNIRANNPWNQKSFTNELKEFMGELPSDKNSYLPASFWNQINIFLELMKRAAYRLVYFRSQPQLDIEAKYILDDLVNTDKISKDEWNRAVWQRILRRGNDGLLESVGPRRISFIISHVGIFVLIVALSLEIIKIFQTPLTFTIFAWVIAAGSIIGLIGKMFFQLSWGQHELAKNIKNFCPHRNIRLRIYK